MQLAQVSQEARKHPNAIVGALAAGGGGQVVLEVSSYLGWSISTGLAIWISASLTTVALFVGKRGLRGVWDSVLNGQDEK